MVNYKGDYSILEGLKEYISTSLKNYFEINEYTKGNSDKIEKELIESINDCIEKQMSVWFGVELSRLRSVSYTHLDVYKRQRKRIVTVEVELLGEKRRIELGIRLPEDK